MKNIITKIDENALYFKEQDIDSWLVKDLLKFYESKIVFFAHKAYRSRELPPVAILAFKESVSIELKNALKTFLLKKKYWLNGRNINPYLLKTISFVSKKVNYDNILSKVNLPICPACKSKGKREFLIQEDKSYRYQLWRCQYCTEELERLTFEIQNETDNQKLLNLQLQKRLRSAFSLHSRKGFKCLDCSRFIPLSLNTEFGISCPYNDCGYIGQIEELTQTSHPVRVSSRKYISLNQNAFKFADGNITLQDRLKNESVTEAQININENYITEYEVLLQVIEEQIQQIKRINSQSTIIQKLLMYEAYKNMISLYTEEMVSYLVHRKQHTDFPIQSRIFQEYVKLIINYLPFTIKKKGEDIDILSLIDPNLSLFLGESRFDSYVDNNNSIPNKTKETYIGGRKNKNYGSCFIGWLIDVIDLKTNNSILDKVVRYGFVNIIMDNSIEKKLPVQVVHYRIPSHYEMDSLVYLQKIRRQIVDSVYFRLNNEKRIVRK